MSGNTIDGKTKYLSINEKPVMPDQVKKGAVWKSSSFLDFVVARGFFLITPDSGAEGESEPMVVELNGDMDTGIQARLKHNYESVGVTVVIAEKGEFEAKRFDHLAILALLSQGSNS